MLHPVNYHAQLHMLSVINLLSKMSQLKLCVLGGTGKTGRHFVSQALANNHEVMTISRRPHKLAQFANNKNLLNYKADIFKPEELVEPFSKSDVVVSMMGFHTRPWPINGYVRTTNSIVRAMQMADKKRLVVLHGVLTKHESRLEPHPYGAFMNNVILRIFGPIFDDINEAEMILRIAGESIDWTAVAPGYLLSNKSGPTDKEIVAKEDAYYINEASTFMQRSDVARYMLRVVEQDLHKGGKVVAIAVP